MGNCHSQEEDSSSMGPSSNERRYRPVPQSFAQASASPSSAMGQPSTAATSRLSAQHERLILELLPFKDANLFHDWLSSVYVRGSWIEFCRDFLTDNHLSPEPDKDKTAQAAKDAINSRKPQFLLYHPDKTGWNDQDHHVRFIVSVVADNMLKSLWSDNDWKKRPLDITKSVYEVLSFLRAVELERTQSPPGYDA